MKLANVFKACVIGASLLVFPPGYAAVSADNTRQQANRFAVHPPDADNSPENPPEIDVDRDRLARAHPH